MQLIQYISDCERHGVFRLRVIEILVLKWPGVSMEH
jgi:hypothetical protein